MAPSTYGWLGIGGLAALGLYAWSKKKAEAVTTVTPPAPTGGLIASPPPGTTLQPSLPGGSVPLVLDWRRFGYDLGFAQGAKDKAAGGLIAINPEPPASELAKTGVDVAAMKAGYAEGYVDGYKAPVPVAVTGSWHKGAFLPWYWKPAPSSYGPVARSR